ncbi:MAG: LysE family translocator [Alphaproteobacteria bacterium]|nr:LysE family translocator [Alphaproteobacteria bacterium]
MQADLLLQFFLVCLVIEATPGPNMGTLALLSLEGGRRAGMMMVAGIATGLALLGFIAALGVSTLLAAYPLVYHWLRWLGIAYLLWMAFSSWQGSTEASPSQLGTNGQHSLYYRHGLILNLLNPKALVFYVSVLPGFIDPLLPTMVQTLVMTALSVIVATIAHSLIVLLASRSATSLSVAGSHQRLRRILALMFAGVALWMAFSG